MQWPKTKSKNHEISHSYNNNKFPANNIPLQQQTFRNWAQESIGILIIRLPHASSRLRLWVNTPLHCPPPCCIPYIVGPLCYPKWNCTQFIQKLVVFYSSVKYRHICLIQKTFWACLLPWKRGLIVTKLSFSYSKLKFELNLKFIFLSRTLHPQKTPPYPNRPLPSTLLAAPYPHYSATTAAMEEKLVAFSGYITSEREGNRGGNTSTKMWIFMQSSQRKFQ